MEPPLSNVKVYQAYALAVFFTTVGAALFISLAKTATAHSLIDGAKHMSTSPWAMSALADYVVGAVFGAVFIFLRDAPPVLGVPSRVVAVIFPFIGNFALLWYVAILLVRQRDIVAALLPKTPDTGGDLEARGTFSAKPRQTGLIVGLFAGLLCFFASVCAWAYLTESLSDGYRMLKTEKWAELTFFDNLAGLVFTVAFVIVREGGQSAFLALWVLAFVFFGNAATCLYALAIARVAHQRELSFTNVLLSRR